jgi:hypothetical protein
MVRREIAVTGHEGLLGVALFLGANRAKPGGRPKCGHDIGFGQSRSNEFDQAVAATPLLLATQALIAQMAQLPSAIDIIPDQQLCRWLLLSLNQLGSG